MRDGPASTNSQNLLLPGTGAPGPGRIVCLHIPTAGRGCDSTASARVPVGRRLRGRLACPRMRRWGLLAHPRDYLAEDRSWPQGPSRRTRRPGRSWLKRSPAGCATSKRTRTNPYAASPAPLTSAPRRCSTSSTGRPTHHRAARDRSRDQPVGQRTPHDALNGQAIPERRHTVVDDSLKT